MERLLELVQHEGVGVDVAAVVVHRALVEVLQNHVSDLPVVSLQVSVTPPLPAKWKYEQIPRNN